MDNAALSNATNLAIDSFVSRLVLLLGRRFDHNMTLGELLVLAFVVQGASQGEWLSAADVAKKSGMGLAAVQRLLHSAFMRGLIEWVDDRGVARRRVYVRKGVVDVIRQHYPEVALMLRESSAEVARTKFRIVKGERARVIEALGATE